MTEFTGTVHYFTVLHRAAEGGCPRLDGRGFTVSEFELLTVRDTIDGVTYRVATSVVDGKYIWVPDEFQTRAGRARAMVGGRILREGN